MAVRAAVNPTPRRARQSYRSGVGVSQCHPPDRRAVLQVDRATARRSADEMWRAIDGDNKVVQRNCLRVRLCSATRFWRGTVYGCVMNKPRTTPQPPVSIDPFAPGDIAVASKRPTCPERLCLSNGCSC